MVLSLFYYKEEYVIKKVEPMKYADVVILNNLLRTLQAAVDGLIDLSEK